MIEIKPNEDLPKEMIDTKNRNLFRLKRKFYEHRLS